MTRAIARMSLVIALATGAGVAAAHGSGHTATPAKAEVVETAFGRSGDAAKAGRTIRVEMSDAMRFSPAQLTVRVGETVRIVAANRGKLLHEIVIGTADELAAHAELMKRYPGMEHDEPYMAHVAPGKNGEIVWQFTAPGEFHFACLLPGHFEAGMRGLIKVIP